MLSIYQVTREILTDVIATYDAAWPKETYILLSVSFFNQTVLHIDAMNLERI